MGKSLRLVNGFPTEVEDVVYFYDKTIVVNTEIGVAGTGYDADHLVFTLPDGETYDGSLNQLVVIVNEVVYGNDKITLGPGTAETTVTLSVAVQNPGTVRILKPKTA